MPEETSEGKSSPNLDMLANVYIKIRDARTTLKTEFTTQDSVLQEQMDLLEANMLDACKDLNASSIKTQHGTIIRSVKSRYWTNDWDSMYTFIKEQGAFGLLEKRLHQTNMKDFLAENPDILPMGLNVESEYTVVVRRPKP
jgi:hypothetical protein